MNRDILLGAGIALAGVIVGAALKGKGEKGDQGDRGFEGVPGAMGPMGHPGRSFDEV